MKEKIIIVAILGCAVAISGCTATHLVYAQNSVLGVDVSVGTEGTEKLTFGFDRDTFTIVPKAEDVGADGTTRETDAMSLASASYVHVDGLSTIEFNHFVATGHAAKQVAASRRAIEDAEALVEPTTTTTSTTTTTEAGALSRAGR